MSITRSQKNMVKNDDDDDYDDEDDDDLNGKILFK